VLMLSKLIAMQYQVVSLSKEFADECFGCEASS
jgi:hypothetical protein